MPLFNHRNHSQRFRMPWGAVAGAAIGLVGNAMSDDKKGGAGTTNKEPWAPATPWLLSNVQQGQALQDKYTKQPFSPQQQAAYDNTYAQSDYMRGLVPSLLGQLGNQQVGFDKNNPTARQNAWNWNLAGDGVNGLGQQSVANARAPVAQDEGGPFTQAGFTNPGAGLLWAARDYNQKGTGGTADMVGGYGTWKYGDPTPEAGSKKYRDMQEFFLMGGNDVADLYGKRDNSVFAGVGSSPQHAGA